MTDDALTITVADGRALVTLAGELDASTCPAARDAVLGMLSDGTDAPEPATDADRLQCVVDLSGVTFVSSAALSLLLELEARAVAADRALVLVIDPDSSLSRQLGQTGLDTQFVVRPPS